MPDYITLEDLFLKYNNLLLPPLNNMLKSLA